MPQGFLNYGRQAIGEDDIAAVVDVLRGDWLTTGPAVERFETARVKRQAPNMPWSATAGRRPSI